MIPISAAFTVTVTNCNLVFGGAVKWEQDTTLGVGSAVGNMTGAATGSYTTGASGDYQFSIPYTTGNFTFKPTKAINKLNCGCTMRRADWCLHKKNITLPAGTRKCCIWRARAACCWPSWWPKRGVWCGRCWP